MKKILFCIFLMLPMVLHAEIPATRTTSVFAASNRRDKASFDVSYCTNGNYNNDFVNGFSLGASLEHFYVDGVMNFFDDMIEGGAHVGGNFVLKDNFNHHFIITPAVGLYWQDSDTILDYGLVFRYNHNNSRVGFVIKGYLKSGVCIGLSFNLGHTY